MEVMPRGSNEAIMSNEFETAYNARREAFLQHVEAEGLPTELQRYFWYHTIDLGNGFVTPGIFDYRAEWAHFALPELFAGASVLDAGPATGFFTFECARRGARVSCIELPSLRGLDRFPGQTVEQSLRKIEHMMFAADSTGTYSEEELYQLLIEGPYRFCEQRLGVEANRHYLNVYDVSPEAPGCGEGFDWVLAGDILVHTLYPMKALAALASVCRGTLAIVERIPGTSADVPMMMYTGGTDPEEDDVNWWLPNRSCLEQLLRKLGFREVREMGRQTAVVQSSGFAVERTVLHAIR
jgi:SAM-dependent methyltransferase